MSKGHQSKKKPIKKHPREILYGFHSVVEALKADKRIFHSVYISSAKTSDRARKIIEIATQKKIQIQTIKPEKLAKLTDSANHQGVAAEVGGFPVEKAMNVVSLIQKRSTPVFVLVLENIEDPHNLGALIRTALCNGVDHILIPKDRSAGPSPAVSRSSAGAMEHADIFMITNTAALLKALKQEGIWVSGLDAGGTTLIFDADLTGHIALVIGGEHKGIRPAVKKECDFLLSIPNKGRINSLNASVAGGIAMYEAMRQRS